MPKFFFARHCNPANTGLNTHMLTISKRLWWLVMLNAVLWTIVACGGFSCSIKREPAKQQKSNTSTQAPRAAIVSTHKPVPVAIVDQDQDGHISTQESQVLVGDRPAVLPTFAMIIGAVLFTSICTAWASSRWRPPEPVDSSSDQSDGERSTDRKLE